MRSTHYANRSSSVAMLQKQRHYINVWKEPWPRSSGSLRARCSESTSAPVQTHARGCVGYELILQLTGARGSLHTLQIMCLVCQKSLIPSLLLMKIDKDCMHDQLNVHRNDTVCTANKKPIQCCCLFSQDRWACSVVPGPSVAFSTTHCMDEPTGPMQSLDSLQQNSCRFWC